MAPRRDSAISELPRRYPKADSTLHDKNIQIWAETVEYDEDQTRMLEEELIETKLRMATAKSREDYLLLEIQQLKESLAQKDSVIEDLQGQLAKFHVCTDFPLFKDETVPAVSPTTYMVPVHETARRDIKKITMAPTSMPYETSLKCNDESTVVSALTLCSDAFEDIMHEEDLLNAFHGEEYQVSLRDETQRARRNVPIMSRQPSCASGIAFMMNYHSRVSVSSSNGREVFVSAENENEQEESDRDAP